MVPCSPKLEKCVKCHGKHDPYIVRIDGLYYVRCPCGKWGRYDFLGLKPQYAADEWAKANRPIRSRWNEIDFI